MLTAPALRPANSHRMNTPHTSYMDADRAGAQEPRQPLPGAVIPRSAFQKAAAAKVAVAKARGKQRKSTSNE